MRRADDRPNKASQGLGPSLLALPPCCPLCSLLPPQSVTIPPVGTCGPALMGPSWTPTFPLLQLQLSSRRCPVFLSAFSSTPAGGIFTAESTHPVCPPPTPPSSFFLSFSLCHLAAVHGGFCDVAKVRIFLNGQEKMKPSCHTHRRRYPSTLPKARRGESLTCRAPHGCPNMCPSAVR